MVKLAHSLSKEEEKRATHILSVHLYQILLMLKLSFSNGCSFDFLALSFLWKALSKSEESKKQKVLFVQSLSE